MLDMLLNKAQQVWLARESTPSQSTLPLTNCTRGARGYNDSILINEDDNGNSTSEQRRNDTDMVDSMKDLSFIITRDEGRGGTITEQ